MLLNQKTNFTQSRQIKIGIVSDTHEELSDQINTIISECDIAIHAGDIGSRTVLEALQPKSGHIIAVAGNNDKPYLWDFKDWELVKHLPHVKELSLPGGKLVIEHGHLHDMHKPGHSDLRNAHPDARAVVYGHTHIQVIDKEEPNTHVINPGAAGYTRNKGGPSCIILTINDNDWGYEVFKFEEESV
ncbi:MAG: metallophosphatase family protein [gamma proteobacterium symbiont of Bathyaustriella thionipta]|nr:metallophosphatase family protein [gamma proteobacterium symbiont of Bathyaustriella thionipta]MCU7951223.1 metallophosphatase family protein [gamma proteobacterium symbiont of Bathyaustriella thionipta]MCU7952701.1 metallophosphatase family protein [gamma proteobacterium symbiont of Bathyaustriella thionipta]MCU7957744.1 metallophosphatase family protein [gamma proteobacterium symbiont of Bathyaustriella thionipta]MCU7968054.1 metallophosphatase family protein [gamma proteobacterium symbion